MKASSVKVGAGVRRPSAEKAGKGGGHARFRAQRRSSPLMSPARRDCTSCGIGEMAGDLASMPPIQRQSAVQSLQRTRGNRFVQRLAIQAKLKVGPVGDKYEREADNVADHVLRMGGPANPHRSQKDGVQARPLASSITPLVQRLASFITSSVQRQGEEEEIQTKPLVQRQEDEEEIQTKSFVQRRKDGGFDAGPRIEGRLAALKGGGSPLPGNVRAYMEPRFGADFSGVRLHTGSEAMQMNRELQAHAFTHGQDIYLGAGAKSPGSPGGNHLLAHELAHTIQQTGSRDRIARWGGPGVPTTHEDVTKDAFKGPGNLKEAYSEPAQEYIAAFTENMDKRAGFMASFLPGKLRQAFNHMAKDPRKYDNLVGYWRSSSEALQHAEGGKYRADGSAADIQHVSNLTAAAVDMWERGNHNQGLAQLALAVHAAEDRGSHGDGKPGTGHDPRRVIKPPKGATKTEYYDPGWNAGWCDFKEHNPGGYDFGVSCGRAVLMNFRNKLARLDSEDGTNNVADLQNYGSPGKFKRKLRGFGMGFGRNIKTKFP
jgi:hypothetical protein